MPNAETTAPIAIVGGGIGGLTAALALARTGWTCTVYEQAQAFAPIGAGVQLGPNAARILADLDVLPALEKTLVRPDAIHMVDASSERTVATIPLGSDFASRFGAPYCVAHRADLHDALVEACNAESAITLRLGSPVTGYRVMDDGVAVDRLEGLTEICTAVIGADGLHSRIAGTLQGTSAPEVSGYVAYRTMIKAERLPGELAANDVTVWLGRDAHLVRYPVSGGRTINVVGILRDRWREEGWNAPADGNDLLAGDRFWSRKVRRIIEAGDDFRKWSLADRMPHRPWHADRVALLGDAAHAVLPFMAQGAAMAIEDAACLANCLAGLSGRPASELTAALKAYEEMRFTRTARLQRESRTVGTVYHARGGRRLGRNWVMSRLTPRKWYDRLAWIYDWRAPAA